MLYLAYHFSLYLLYVDKIHYHCCLSTVTLNIHLDEYLIIYVAAAIISGYPRVGICAKGAAAAAAEASHPKAGTCSRPHPVCVEMLDTGGAFCHYSGLEEIPQTEPQSRVSVNYVNLVLE